MRKVAETAEVQLPAWSLVGLTRDVPLSQMEGAVAPMFDEMNAAIGKAGYAFWGPSVALYQMVGGAIRCVVGAQLAEDVDGLERIEIAASRALCDRRLLTMTDFTPAHEAIHAEVAARGLTLGTWGREVYHSFHPERGTFDCDIIIDIAD